MPIVTRRALLGSGVALLGAGAVGGLVRAAPPAEEARNTQGFPFPFRQGAHRLDMAAARL